MAIRAWKKYEKYHQGRFWHENEVLKLFEGFVSGDHGIYIDVFFDY